MDEPFIVVRDSVTLSSCIMALWKEPEIALDTETYHTPGLPETPYGFTDPFTNSVRLVQMKGENTCPYVVDLKAFEPAQLEPLRNLLRREDILWVIINAKFDWKMIAANLKIKLKRVWDPMIASQLIGHAMGTTFGKARGHGLKPLLKDFLGIPISKEEQVSYWGGELTPSQEWYAATDVLHLLRLKKKLKDLLEAPYPSGYDMGPVTQLEMDLIPVLAQMEMNGIGFDRAMFKRVQACAKAALPALVERICKSFGIGIQRGFMGISPAINLDSVPQLLGVLRDNGIEVEDTEADTLEEASKSYPKLKDLLEYKKLTRALKFPYEDWAHPLTGRIHPSYNQLGAGTSRLSCQDPNLQQVPKIPLRIPDRLLVLPNDEKYLDKDEFKKSGKKIYYLNYRYCFVAEAGNDMIGSDLSGQELCIVAALSNDQAMCHALSQPEKLPDGSKNPEADLHSIAASGLHGIPVADIVNGARKPDGGKYRDDGKIINFSTVYGKSKEGFAKDWGVSTVEAGRRIKAYFTKFWGLGQALEEWKALGKATKLSRFPQGHALARIRFLDGNGRSDRGAVERAASNTPVQGTGATMIKVGLVKVQRKIDELQLPVKLCLQVHDEIVAESRSDVTESSRVLIQSLMEDAANQFLLGRVPGRAEAKSGPCWPK